MYFDTKCYLKSNYHHIARQVMRIILLRHSSILLRAINSLWKVQASNSDDLRVEVAVVDQVLDDEARRLKGLFPEWADVIAYSSFMSSYFF